METFVAELPRLIGDVFVGIGRDAAGYEAHRWPDGALVVTGEPSPWFNAAIIDESPQAEARLHDAVRLFAERSAPALVIFTASVAARLEPIARAAGLIEAGLTPWMVYEPSALPPPTDDRRYAIEQVTNPVGLREANAISAACFGIQPDVIDRVWGPHLLGMLGFRLFVARRDGEMISTVMTTEGGTTVGIWTMATLPDRQRQGAGRALLDHILAEHAVRGARRFYLGATEEGRRLYESAGFRTVTETALWIASGAEGH